MSATSLRDPRWIVGRRFDLTILAVPAIAALASLGLMRGPREHGVPLCAFLVLIVAFDVAHVWATIYLTYLDREVMAKRKALLLLPIPLTIAVAFRLHLHSPALFWTLLAYVAIYHFVMQQWGFIALYKSRASETSRFDYYLDKWTLWAGALGPVLLWHASPARQFDWFNAGESFIGKLDPSLGPDILTVVCVVGAVYVLRQIDLAVSKRRFNLGKNLWMGCAWTSWFVGIGLAQHPLVSAAFLNLFHGIPFLALVWHRCNRRWEGKTSARSRLLAYLSQRKNWFLFYGLILAIAIVEESLWDGIVWRVYLPSLLGTPLPRVSGAALSAWVAVLSVPQIVHYYLDAWIWKLDGSNPDLHTTVHVPVSGAVQSSSQPAAT